MAIEQNVSASDAWFAGEDKVLQFEILQADGVTPQDVAAWALSWTMRKSDRTAAQVLAKATSGQGITITGTYNVVRAVNTQRVLVAVSDDDTDALEATTYRHALKRNDPGSETVLSFGNVALLRT